MVGKASLDKILFEGPGVLEATDRIFKIAFGMGIGLTAGIVGGIYLGEQINNNFETLRQAHSVVRYAIDATSGLGCGLISAVALGKIIPKFYRN